MKNNRSLNKKSDVLPFLNVITGPMFSGKTCYLIKQIVHHRQQGERVIVFKPKVDNRFAIDRIVTRLGKSLKAIPISHAQEIATFLTKNGNYDVVAIDEIHFFSVAMIKVIETLLVAQYKIWVAGLNKGFCDHNLEVMNQLLPMADNIWKFNAACDICQKPNAGTKIQAVNKRGEALLPKEITNFVGDKEQYQVRCRRCYVKKIWD